MQTTTRATPSTSTLEVAPRFVTEVATAIADASGIAFTRLAARGGY